MAKTNSVDKKQLQADIEAIKKAKTEKEVDDMLKSHPVYKQIGYCHLFWEKKRKILKDRYGIEWRSPSELNPETDFD